MIYIKVREDGSLETLDKTVSDSVRFETVKFKFPISWDGYTKTAVFKNGDVTLNVILNIEGDLYVGENEIYVPHEVLKFPGFTLSVFGILGNSRATTERITINVIQSGYAEGDKPSEPSPTEYEQLTNLVNQTKSIAQSVRDDANNGVFKGDKGDKGDPAVTDQEYNPRSKNAQSGVAVAKAVEPKADKTYVDELVGNINTVLATVVNGGVS